MRVKSAAFAALVLFVGCARQMPPPGGPPDQTPPYIAAIVPADDSVHVGLDTRIRIQFSEAMDHRSVERAVFVSPQPMRDLDFRWKGKTLEIRLPEGLRPDRTYVVTVGQESADEWRNKMVSSYSFGFATGAALNRGELLGQVLKPDISGQVFVWAYDLEAQGEPDPGRDRPAYVTQPDPDGHFELRRLGPGRYRVFAFVDGDGNRDYTAGVDALAVPPADVVLAEADRVRLGVLLAAVRDTSAPRLAATRTPDGRHVLLRFDEPVRIEGTPDVSELQVLAVYQNPTDSSRVGLLTSPQIGGKPYRVRLEAADHSGHRVLLDETVRGDAGRDRRAPEVLDQMPEMNARQVAVDAPLTLIFSDAMRRQPVMNFWVASDSTDVPEGAFHWTAANRLVFVPEKPWPPGQTMRLKGALSGLFDAAGNALEEDVQLAFAVRDTGDWGTVIGSVLPADAPVVVRVHALDRQAVAEAVVAKGDTSFVFEHLMAGVYRLDGFVDRDGDGRWFAGAVSPFLPAGARVTGADTLVVRARWTTESPVLDVRSWWVLPRGEEETPRE